MADLMPERRKVDEYEYRDETGRVVYTVQRWTYWYRGKRQRTVTQRPRLAHLHSIHRARGDVIDMGRSVQARKGYDGERRVLSWLLAEGYRGIDRPRAGRPDDVGDISGLPLVVSVKNHSSPKPGQWVDELEHLIANAGKETGIVWYKRRGKANPDDWIVCMTGRQFRALLRAYVSQGEAPPEQR